MKKQEPLSNIQNYLIKENKNLMKKLLTEWRSFLAESRDDPVYSQDTYNAFLLLAISNERGGNRDEIKNDIRALGEVLTVTPVEQIDGGIQKNLGEYFLSTMKLRIRLPSGIERERLTQQIVNDINKMRGLTVRRHGSERAQELREEEDEYPGTLPAYVKGHQRKKRKLIGKGGQANSAPYTKKPSYKRAKSAPAGFGGSEE
jgi:hypothetical protein